MILAYLDESYSSKWAVYWIAAVVCPENTIAPLTHALDAVVMEASDKHDLWLDRQTELHGHPLFHGRKDWEGLAKKARARIGVYKAAVTAIAALDVQIVVRGVHRERLKERYFSPWHPHKVVLQHALEDIDCIAETRGEPALVIADEIDGAVEHRRALWNYQRAPTIGWKPRTLTNIVDTLHFAPSHASRLVQAADLVAYLHGRMRSGMDTDERAIKANAELWAILQPRVYNVHCWIP